MARIVTLKRRSEFLRVRGGLRHAGPWFVVEGKARAPTEGRTVGCSLGNSKAVAGPRFGFTVTKQLGSAVVRNQIRRRLKAAVAELPDGTHRNDFDYVIVARDRIGEPTYAALRDALSQAFVRIHKPGVEIGGDRKRRR